MYKMNCIVPTCNKRGIRYGNFAGVELVYCNGHKVLFENIVRLRELGIGYNQRLNARVNKVREMKMEVVGNGK